MKGLSSGGNFAKRLDLEARENALVGIGIVADKLERGGLALHIDDHQAAAAVGEGATDNQAALIDQRFEIFEMRGPHGWSQPRAVGAVIADNHKKHFPPPSLRDDGETSTAPAGRSTSEGPLDDHAVTLRIVLPPRRARAALRVEVRGRDLDRDVVRARKEQITREAAALV